MSQGTYTIGGGKYQGSRNGTRVTDKFRTREEKLAERAARAVKARALRERCNPKA